MKNRGIKKVWLKRATQKPPKEDGGLRQKGARGAPVSAYNNYLI